MSERRTASHRASPRHRSPEVAPPRRWRPIATGCLTAGAAAIVVAGLTGQQSASPLDAPAAAAANVAATGTRVAPPSSTPLVTPTPSSSSTGSRAHLDAAVRPHHRDRPQVIRYTAAMVSGLAANGIPTVALNAYRVAAARIDHDQPDCGLNWSLLAGIGRVESDHGQYGGAVLLTDGFSSKPTIGPALTGKHGTYVPAPPDGRKLDGDAKYAHALGPMQFIPQTWAIYGADGDDNGVANVFDINDATLGAARYLCAAGGDLRKLAGRRRAVLAYNHSKTYLAEVLALATAYRLGIPVHGVPHGNLTGKLRKVRRSHVPPANPGNPTAVHHKKKRPAHPKKRTAPKRHHARPPKPTASAKPSPSPSPSPTPASPSPSHSPGPSSGPPSSGAPDSPGGSPTPSP